MCRLIIGLIILLTLFLTICEAQSQKQNISLDQRSKDTLDNFNERASQSFLERYSSSNFGSLHSMDKCILEKSIYSYLNLLNDKKAIAIDSFYVKNYSLSSINLNFNFVVDKKEQMYFVYFDRYNSYWRGREIYNQVNSINEFKLKELFRYKILDINSETVNKFFNETVFVSDDKVEQYEQANRILKEIFPDLIDQISTDFFLDSIHSLTDRKYDRVKMNIDSISTNSFRLKDGHLALKIYKTYIGIILLDFVVNPNNVDTLRMNLYFIPKELRLSKLIDVEKHLYNECFQH